MKSYKVAIVLTAVSTMTGCTTLKSWFSNKDPEQSRLEQSNVRQELVLPEGLGNPKRSDEFVIDNNSPELGDFSHTSPTMLLVIFDKSWINEEDPHQSKIMIERPDLVTDFPAFVQQGVDSYIELNDLNVNKINDSTYRVTQDLKVETGFWFWESMETAEQYQYDLTIAFQPHNRSGEIYVDTVSYKKVDEELAPNIADQVRAASLAKQTLNDFMLELDYLYRVKLKNEKSSLDVSLELVKDVSGHSVISSQQEIKFVFNQLEDVLDSLGFDIVEEDKDLFSFDVYYEKGSQSIWDSVFNSDVANTLDLPTGDYKVEINTTVSGVHIKFKDVSGAVLSDQQITELYEVILKLVKDEDLEL